MSNSLGSFALKALGYNVVLFSICFLFISYNPAPYFTSIILPTLLIVSFILLSEWFDKSFWKQFLINITFTISGISIVSVFLNVFGPVYLYLVILALLFSVSPSSLWVEAGRNIQNSFAKRSIRHIIFRNLITLGLVICIFFIPFLFLSGNATGLAAIAVGAAFVNIGFYGASFVLLISLMYHSLSYEGNAVESSVYSILVHSLLILIAVILVAIYAGKMIRLGDDLSAMIINSLGFAVNGLLSSGFAKYCSSKKEYQIIIAIGSALILLLLQPLGLYFFKELRMTVKLLSL